MVMLLSLGPIIIDGFTIYSSWVLVEINLLSLKLLPIKNEYIYVESCWHYDSIGLGFVV